MNNLSRKMIRIMIDTNIFISAILFPRSRTAEALLKSMTLPYQPVVCGYVVDEFQEKFSDRTVELEAFLYTSLSVFEIVTTPEKNIEIEAKIRDKKDRPILRAALNANVDLFLTGDKDFLESSVENPRIISVADFLEM